MATVPAVLVAMALAGVLLVLFVSEPLPDDGADGARLLDVTGETEFARLTADFARRDVPLSALQQHTIDAVLAAEDADFYTHPGVNVTSVVRALVANVRSGEVSQGGSTITQQYIKVASRDDAQTLWRKVREAALAIKLERTHGKDEILERYLNAVYFGRGAYGIQAGAQAYFGVDAGQLSLTQSAVLAGVLPAPSLYDPLVDIQSSHVRYRYVLGRMTDEGWLDGTLRDQLFSEQPPTVAVRSTARDDAPWFTSLVRQELDLLGFADARGLEVVTTLNLGIQRHAERAYQPAFATTDATGAMVSVAPGTGGVLAVVGGEDYTADQVNLALASRQPGSTFKPVALAAWLAQNRSPDHRFDSPGSLTLPDADAGEDWMVSNYGGASHGQIGLREATARSSNTVYAQMATDVGHDAVAQMANRLFDREGGEAFEPFASLVLGTEEVTPLEMAAAYATFASGGVRHDVHTVVQVRRGEEVLYNAASAGEQVMDADVAYAVSDVLRGVVSNGTGQAAAIGRPAAGKTGTTQDYGDAWFAGYTPQVATVVWMGNRDDRASLPGEETGGGLPAQTWAAFMAAVHEGLEVSDFPQPDWSRFGVTPPAPASTATATATATPTATPTSSETPTPTPSATIGEPDEDPSDIPTPTPRPQPDRDTTPDPDTTPDSAPVPTPGPSAPPQEPATAAPTPTPAPTITQAPEPATRETSADG